ncbi:MAG: aspartate kinase [Pararheinheimera sp.]|nr:aspartate kinase [Rheinheimera sp.]
MALYVQKFGGTSVGTPERIEAVAEQVIQTVHAGHKVVVVVSAMAGETNRLLGLAHQIDSRPATRELDMLAASGEQVSIALLAMALIKRGHPAVSLLADQIGILTDNKFSRARILSVGTERLWQELEQGHIVIAAGFQGRDIEGNITTLGRGGSDTTAVALAAALKADECQIFTDVEGIYSMDPRICSDAFRLPYVDAASMLELASLGAKVLHSRSVEYAAMHQVPVRVLSSFRPDQGTLVCYEDQTMSVPALTGLACQTGEVWLELNELSSELHIALLKEFARLAIETDMLKVQYAPSGLVQMQFSVNQNDLNTVEDICNELKKKQNFTLQSRKSLGKLSIVGIGLKSNPAITATVFEQLQLLAVQVVAVSCAEIKLSIVVPETELNKVAVALHTVLLGSVN